MRMAASIIGSSVIGSALHAVLVLHPKGLYAQDRMLAHTPLHRAKGSLPKGSPLGLFPRLYHSQKG